MSKKTIKPPTYEKTPKDIGLVALKVGLGFVPFLSSTVELVNIIETSAEKRITLWRKELTEGFNALAERVSDLESRSLAEDEQFISLLIAITQIAVRTHRKEKIRILRNTVLTSAKGYKITEYLQSAFLGIVDRYTAEHFLLLRRGFDRETFALACSKAAFSCKSTESGSVDLHVEKIAPYLLPEVTKDVSDEIFFDLHRDGLVHGSEGFACTVSMLGNRGLVTSRGSAFLCFIGNDSNFEF